MGFLLYGYLLCLVLACFNVSILANPVSSMQPSCVDHERSALLQFKHSFQIDCAASGSPSAYPKLKSWTDATDCCLWDGVDCEEETGHVVGIDLTSSCFLGTFPPNSTLFTLSHLKKLSLADNFFECSSIPSGLGHLNKLQSLNLSYSAFCGQIPVEISRLSELTVLDLSSFDQPTPLKLHEPSLEQLVQNLTHLQGLYLGDVDISSTVPIILTNLTSLKHVNLQLSHLQGEVPTSLFQLPHLETLVLHGNNNLTGLIPQFQWNSPLKELDLSQTAFSGHVPSSIGNLARLEILDLRGSLFSGSIPSSIGNLTKLTTLALEYNNFQGEIPFSFANLTNLEIIDFTYNNVVMSEKFTSGLPKMLALNFLGLGGINSGTESDIPTFLANLTKLTYLDLRETHLTGLFPRGFEHLTQLSTLLLGKNNLKGPIPPWFSLLTNLQSLDLSFNNLVVEFDTFFNFKNLQMLNLSRVNLTLSPYSRTNLSLSKLKTLDLAFCNLNEFPKFLRYQDELQLLSLRGNNINGSIPQWLVNTTKESLRAIDLSDNNLTGFERPIVVLPWTRLQVLDFSGNKLQGQLPTPADSMMLYDVSGNILTGVIPKEICNAKSLLSLDLSNNNMRGEIPNCMGHQLGESLQLLNLRGNNFQGTIPPTFTASCKLKMINLRQNQLEGKLPRSLANCTMLEVLDIGKNYVNDTFPSWLGSLPRLQVLALGHNNFHGSIDDPKTDIGFHCLRIIDLSFNFHIGILPARYLQSWHAMRDSKENQSGSPTTVIPLNFQSSVTPFRFYKQEDYSITITNKGLETLYPKILNVFRVIDLSSNNFIGKIPDVIGDLKGLQALNLSNNKLDGRIPFSLGKIIDLESLDLSSNMLIGTIPSELVQLTFLEVFNISHNHLIGPIPQGQQFNTFDNSSFEGNFGLCGGPLSKKCKIVGDTSPSPPVTSDESDEDSQLIDWIITLLGCLSGIIVGFVIGKFYITDKYHEWFMETFARRPKKSHESTKRNR